MNEKKEPVNKEALRLLAMEIGLRNAARKLGINENTALTWSRDLKWDLRKNGLGAIAKPPSISLQSNGQISDCLGQSHKELEQQGKSAIARASVKAARVQEGYENPNAQALNLLAGALGKVFGWSQSAGTSVNITGDKILVVCDEARRNELIEQRQRLLGEKQAKAVEV